MSAPVRVLVNGAKGRTGTEAVRAVSRVESQGYISVLNERVQVEEAFDASLESAHRAYARERESLVTDPGVAGAG